jgi:hypothetical protein
MWEFTPKGSEPQPLSAMYLIQSIQGSDILITGDNAGVISLWDIATLCLREELNPQPPSSRSFKAHVKAIQVCSCPLTFFL